jgi:hypothetical protein
VDDELSHYKPEDRRVSNATRKSRVGSQKLDREAPHVQRRTCHEGIRPNRERLRRLSSRPGCADGLQGILANLITYQVNPVLNNAFSKQWENLRDESAPTLRGITFGGFTAPCESLPRRKPESQITYGN